MNLDEMVRGVHDALAVRRVYGDPVERDGATIVPVAAVRGGGGGGGNGGGGGGFGLEARPVGVFVLKDGEVDFEPAVDVVRIATVALLVGAVVAFLWRPRS